MWNFPTRKISASLTSLPSYINLKGRNNIYPMKILSESREEGDNFQFILWARYKSQHTKGKVQTSHVNRDPLPTTDYHQ